jgi:hypothetical protein
MKLYKLTSSDNKTRKGRYNETQWGENVTITIPEDDRKNEMCGAGILHAYTNINLALLMNPIHAGFAVEEFNLWESEGELVADGWDKCGCHQLSTIKKLDIPLWYINKETRKDIIVLFSILCAEAVLDFYEKECPKDNRPRKAISIAREYLNTKSMNAARAARAAETAAMDAARAARAARAADAAARAAASSADAARNARAAASSAARAAARAAGAAACVSTNINFGLLADQAVNTIMNVKK